MSRLRSPLRRPVARGSALLVPLLLAGAFAAGLSPGAAPAAVAGGTSASGAVAGPSASGAVAPGADKGARKYLPPVGHVFVINLENKGYDETWGPASAAPYLPQTYEPRASCSPSTTGRPTTRCPTTRPRSADRDPPADAG